MAGTGPAMTREDAGTEKRLDQRASSRTAQPIRDRGTRVAQTHLSRRERSDRRSGRGVTPFPDRPVTPHPNPLPQGEGGRTSLVQRSRIFADAASGMTIVQMSESVLGVTGHSQQKQKRKGREFIAPRKRPPFPASRPRGMTRARFGLLRRHHGFGQKLPRGRSDIAGCPMRPADGDVAALAADLDHWA
jgi:hypothetical protein